MKDIDLNTLPKDCTVPTRHHVKCDKYRLGNVILVSKGDFEYMAERRFKGRFSIANRLLNGHFTSHRIAVALEGDKTILLSVAQERRTTGCPDGATWRTVRLVSAYKTEDGKLCVIEIEPPRAKEGGAE